METVNEQKEDKSNKNQKLDFEINGIKYQSEQQYLTGAQLKILAGIANETDLYLTVRNPWQDELISNEEKVDLARQGLEHFYTKKNLEFKLNNEVYSWECQYIYGKQLREIGDIPEDHSIFLKINGPWEDELVEDECKIDLARPGLEHFYSKLIIVNVTIIINDKPFEVKPGDYLVSEIKKIGKIPSAYKLVQLINGVLTPLDDSATINIKGNEEFFGHVRDGSSSFTHHFPEDQISELKKVAPSCSIAVEGGHTYILISNFNLPKNCNPQNVDLLLCPQPRDGYASRLFFSSSISSNSSRNWNGQVRILDRNWYAFSWQVPEGLKLREILLVHLEGLR